MGLQDFGMSFFPEMAQRASMPAPTPHGPLMNYYRQMAPLRIASMLDRSVHGGGAMRGGPNPGAMGELNGGIDPSVFSDPSFRAHANAMLQRYGLSVPEYQGSNAILPNSGFFGNHPGLSGAIEGALFGAAATRPSENVGEGVSNAIIGGLQGGAMRRQALQNRYMAPFQAAEQMEQLGDMQQKRDLNQAMIDWHQAQTKNYADRTLEKADYENGRLAATRPIPILGPNGETRGWKVFNTQTSQWENQLDNTSPFPKPTSSNGLSSKGVPASKATLYKEMFGSRDPDTLEQKDWQKLNGEYDRRAIQRGTAMAGGTTHARNNANLKDDVKETVTDKASDTYEKGFQSFMKGAGSRPSFWVSQRDPQGNRIKSGDNKAQRTWYESNFPPPGGGSSPNTDLNGQVQSLINSIQSPTPRK